MKISIRSSLLTILIFFLVCISTAIVVIDCYNFNNTSIKIALIAIVIFLGIVMAFFFAQLLSKSINKLVHEAQAICQLQLDKNENVLSHITEIDQIFDSLAKVRNALKSFQSYMPIALVKKLITTGKVATPGGESKYITVVFTDIKNFTSLAAQISSREIMMFLSEYFQVINKTIRDYNGTLDKYLGDGSLLFWGAPQDDSQQELHACQAMLEINSALQELNTKWHRENKPEIFTRIGINSGYANVGNVGSNDRLCYTAVGEAVNLASRLENLNKEYGTRIIVSEFTYQKVRGNFKFRMLDKVKIRGREHGIYIYELLSKDNHQLDQALEKYNHDFANAFADYEMSDWIKARSSFVKLKQEYPDDHLLDVFIKRCETLLITQPQDWDGIWI